jgi:hypothetical protein
MHIVAFIPTPHMTRSLALIAPLLILLTGCASLLNSTTGRLAGGLSTAILNENDLDTVRDGAPAYLLLVDGLIEGDPKNENLLMSGARLYSAYASVFVTDAERAQRMTDRARDYGARALCLHTAATCQAGSKSYDDFVTALDGLPRDAVPALYAYASAWAGWIQVHSGDWLAIADLPKIEAAMRRVVTLDEAYDHGGAHLYLGVLNSLRPPALGGKPEEGQAHFLRAIELSSGRNLMAKVQYAEKYARLVFDRPLHDRLLNEVLAADAGEPGLTLINTLAKQRAKQLLASAKDYF